MNSYSDAGAASPWRLALQAGFTPRNGRPDVIPLSLGTTSIGREQCDVILSSPALDPKHQHLSRAHARLTASSSGVLLEDCSSHGTCVDGERICKAQREIHEGAVIVFGADGPSSINPMWCVEFVYVLTRSEGPPAKKQKPDPPSPALSVEDLRTLLSGAIPDLVSLVCTDSDRFCANYEDGSCLWVDCRLPSWRVVSPPGDRGSALLLRLPVALHSSQAACVQQSASSAAFLCGKEDRELPSSVSTATLLEDMRRVSSEASALHTTSMHWNYEGLFGQVHLPDKTVRSVQVKTMQESAHSCQPWPNPFCSRRRWLFVARRFSFTSMVAKSQQGGQAPLLQQDFSPPHVAAQCPSRTVRQ